jgi:hypothetical protein
MFLRISKKTNKAGDRTSFEYICADPVFDGKWKILSHKELTEVEIQRQLRVMAVSGYQRPTNGRMASFKWPQTTKTD